LIYLIDKEKSHAHLVASTGLEINDNAARASVDLKAVVQGPMWPLRRVLEVSSPELVTDLKARFGPLPGGLWPEPAEAGLVLPIASPGQTHPTGFLIVGLSPRRILDAEYRGFFDLIVGHLSTAVANARANEEERRRAAALAEVDRAKTQFFSNVSHEFRTPLTLMLGPPEAMLEKRGSMPPEDQAQVEAAHRNGLRLLKLVNSLLDFSRIEAGRVQACYEPVDLATLTADLASNFRSAMEAGGLKLNVDCPSLTRPVYVDREMWEQVVLNLLSNAFKFTFGGSVSVKLESDGNNAILTVADTGVGIPDTELPHIFERFHRAENTRGRTYEGTGIGLALVQELVKLHGGNVHVQSRMGEGTTFTVSVPFGTEHLPSDRIGASVGSQPSTAVRARPFTAEALTWVAPEDLAGPIEDIHVGTGEHAGYRHRVLLADDNSDMRDHIAHILGSRYDIVTVSNGRAALEEARRMLPDLLLSDVMMPELDGFGLLKELREDPRLREVPVILLSARAGEEARAGGINAGADDYLIKPFSARELSARVSTTLRLATMRREYEQRISADLQALRRIQEVGTRLIGSHDLRARLSEILAAAAELIGTDKGNIQLYDPESRVLRIVVHQGFGERFLNRFLNRGWTEVCDVAARKIERMIWEDIAIEPALQGTEDLEIILGDRIRAIQSTPIVGLGGQLLSFLNNHYRVPHRPGERDLRLLDLLARMAAEFIERSQSEEALRSSEARFRTLAEAIPQLCWMAYGDGHVFWHNRRWYEYTGTTFEQMEGSGWHMLHDPEMLPAVVERWTESIRSGEPFEMVFPLKGGDGVFRPFLTRVVPLCDSTGRVTRWFGTNTDVSELKEIEKELRNVNADLEQFAYSASHDLQEPLRTVKIFSQLLAGKYRDRLDGQALEFLDNIRLGGMRMEGLVRDLLSYTQVNRFERPVEPVDAQSALHGALSNLGGATAESGAKIDSDPLPSLPVHTAHLQQLFQNLVSNVIKYGRPGVAPVVHIGVKRQNGTYLFSVSDNGIGIEAQYKDRIFGLFKRLHTADKYSGTGIGLAICQRIVERYHGRIWVESEPEKGSTFFFTLPA
jgi:PAS domain S-box-containing protein